MILFCLAVVVLGVALIAARAEDAENAERERAAAWERECAERRRVNLEAAAAPPFERGVVRTVDPKYHETIVVNDAGERLS